MTNKASSENPYRSPQETGASPIQDEMLLDESLLAFASEEFNRAKRWIMTCTIACFGIILITVAHFLVNTREVAVVSILFSFLNGLFYVISGLLMLRCSKAISSYRKSATVERFLGIFQADAQFWTVTLVYLAVLVGFIIGYSILTAIFEA